LDSQQTGGNHVGEVSFRINRHSSAIGKVTERASLLGF